MTKDIDWPAWRLVFRSADQQVVFAEGGTVPLAELLPLVGWAIDTEKPDHIDLWHEGRHIVILPEELVELARSIPSELLSQELRERIAAC